jgi:hypothetical protein
MGSAALAFRLMGMMAILFAAAAGYFAVPALRIAGRRFLDMERLLGVFVRSPWAALSDARGRLC